MCCAEAITPRSSRTRVGLDLGSRWAKLVVLGPQGVVQNRVLEAVPFILATRARGGVDRAALGLEEDWPLVATGYGRAALSDGRGITEIRAHFKGARAQTGLDDFTLVELGGQDSKVIHVEGGRVLDFVTNDRCAAGTGRYLENMARLLGAELAQLAQAQGPGEEINNTCAIFGETEILGRLLDGVPVPRLLAGVNLSVARRVKQMVRRYHPRQLVFCGGVALNQGVVRMIQEVVDCPVLVPALPQLNGALGCCLEEEEA